MPIVREYAPAAGLVGQAAYQAGLGKYNQQQQQVDLQNRQLNQQRDLTLFSAGAQQQSQYLDINAQMNQQANALAGSQWNTMAGIAGQSFLNQQQNQYSMASQVYGAGVNAALQTQNLQTNANLQLQDQLFKNDQLIKQLQQTAAGQQFAAAADLGMQAQRLSTGLVQQQIGIGADTAQQNRGIVASAMQQQEGIASSERQQQAAIAAERQNTVDQLASGDWRTQYGAAIDQQNLSAQMANTQYLQEKELQAAQVRQQASIDAAFKQQVTDIEAKQALQLQAQQVQAAFQNQDVALQQQQLSQQLQQRQQEQIFNAWAQQQSQAAQQMANERMAVWDQSNANYRAGMQVQAQAQQSYMGQSFDLYKMQQLQAYDSKQNQLALDQANAKTSQEMQYRKEQQILQLQDQALKVNQAVSMGQLRPEEAEMLMENLYSQMGSIEAQVPTFQEPDLLQQWKSSQVPIGEDGSFVYRQPNGNWAVHETTPKQDNSLKTQAMQQQMEMEKQQFSQNRMATAYTLADKIMQSSLDPKTGQPKFKHEQALDMALFDMGDNSKRVEQVNLVRENMGYIRNTFGATNPAVDAATRSVESLTAKASTLRNKTAGLTIAEAAELKNAQKLIADLVKD